jgi:hypothetical protein|nr:MAG TPA: hypothetical protein [Caudoviricetes sp.]
MSDKVKVREGNDGYSYPYTSPDLVIDENGKSASKKFEEIDSQFKDIATYNVEDFKNNTNTYTESIKSMIETVQFENKPSSKIFFSNNIIQLDNDSIIFKDIDNIIIEGNNNIIKKHADATDKSLFMFVNCNNIIVKNLNFVGSSEVAVEVWGDDGIVFDKCKNVSIQNCTFKNFGDSAIRNTNYDATGDAIINLNYTVTNCKFENVYQTSITPGGCKNIIWTNNISKNINGSHKFSNNKPEDVNLIFKGNIIDGNHYGIEMQGIKNATITNNQFLNLETSVFIYNGNETYQTTEKQRLLENYVISDNIFKNYSKDCIYIQSTKSTDNIKNSIKNVSICNNIVNTSTNSSTEDDNNKYSFISVSCYNILDNILIQGNICNNIKTFFNSTSANYNNINISNNVINICSYFISLMLNQASFTGISNIQNIFIKNNAISSQSGKFLTFNFYSITTYDINRIFICNNYSNSSSDLITVPNNVDINLIGNTFICTSSSVAPIYISNIKSCCVENNTVTSPNRTEYTFGGSFVDVNKVIFKNNYFEHGLATNLKNLLQYNLSTSTDVEGLKSDLNSLITKLKEINVII